MAEKTNVENTKSSSIDEKKESSEKKRPIVGASETMAKKPKLNSMSTIQAFSEKNLVNPSKNEIGKSSIVPMPTARLEDIVSVETLPTDDIVPKPKFTETSYKLSNLSSKNEIILNPLNQVDDDEALAKILKNKHSKRTLYTGRKTNPTGAPFQPAKLFDLATKILIDNLDEVYLRISNYSKYFI